MLLSLLIHLDLAFRAFLTFFKKNLRGWKTDTKRYIKICLKEFLEIVAESAFKPFIPILRLVSFHFPRIVGEG